MKITQNNYKMNIPSFKALKVEPYVCKYLKCRKSTLEKMPEIKHYSKDFDILITKDFGILGNTKQNLSFFANGVSVSWLVGALTGIPPVTTLILSTLAIACCGISLKLLYNCIKKAGFSVQLELQQPKEYNPYTDKDLTMPNFENTNKFHFSNLNELKRILDSNTFQLTAQELMLTKDKRSLMEIYKEHASENNSFLYFILTLPLSIAPDRFQDFLYDITSDKEMGIQFVKEMTGTARNCTHRMNDLKTLLRTRNGDDYYFKKWYGDGQKGYLKAYSDYYNTEIYDKSKSLLDLLKQSPNVAPWTLKTRAKELGVEFSLGNLPESFESKELYLNLIDKLRDLNIDIHNKDTKKKYKQKEDGSFDLKVNDKIFNVESKSKGLSAKLVFRVTPQDEPEKSYIIKFIPYKHLGSEYQKNKDRENYDLRADSTYSNAMIDFYLKLNNCPSAPDILYYDCMSQSSVYTEEKGVFPQYLSEAAYTRDLDSLRELAGIIDVKRLGININDFNYTNFIQSNDGTLKLIDSGHATFQNDMKPQVIYKHISLGNLCGRE